MAECLSIDSDDDMEDVKLDIIGSFVVTIESIICPKPLNVWQVPGAFQKAHSHILKILSHGCKIDNKGNSLLWNFILGLRVLHPSLWPSSLFGAVDNKGSVSVCQWLTISLKNHLLSKQVKTLVSESDRVSSYYHEWGLLRFPKYIEAFFTTLEALEQNSQVILANINHSMMVCYYSRHKNGSLPKNYFLHHSSLKKNKVAKTPPISVTDAKTPSTIAHLVRSAANITVSTSDPSIDKSIKPENLHSISEHANKLEISEHLAPRISPNFLHVNYGSLTSDGEKSFAGVGDDSVGDDGYSTVDMETNSKEISRKLPAIKNDRKMMLSERDMSSTPFENSSVPNHLSSKNHAETNDKKVIRTVGPSPFLIKFLSKSNKDIARRMSEDTTIKALNIPQLSSDSNKVNCSASSDESTSKGLTQLNFNVNTNTLSDYSYPNVSQGNTEKSFKNINTKKNVQTHSRSKSDGAQPLRSFDASPLHCTANKPTLASERGFIDQSFSLGSNGKTNWKPFMEDGGKSVQAEADGFFPCPKPGQNLIEFLSSDQFSKSSAQLDRENAHFSVAEAVLAAVEQMNYRSSEIPPAKVQHTFADESEEDFAYQRKIERNKRRVRIRRPKIIYDETSDEPVTTDYSMLDSPDVSCSSESETPLSEIDASEKTDQVGLTDESENVATGDQMSAENVALSILRHYNERLLPKACDLQWLVTEQEVPQKLLPMPNSIAISPDETETSDGKTLLRGTSEWAPPRPQLILTLHQNKNRNAHLVSQKWRCAGCGMSVSEKLSRHFRLCHYLGRYFCTTCHANKKNIIPARVIHKWDFKKYCVSNFSFELLARMVNDPLFNVGSLNPRLFKQSRSLKQAHVYRVQLYHARVYITTCSRASKEKSLLKNVPLHWSAEPQVYSLSDLISAKEKTFLTQIKFLTTSCISHISSCEVCLGQGFICELCRQGGPIFPYQLDNVTQCTKCHACYHFLCFSPVNSCIRCRRRDRRGKEENS